MTHSQFDDVDQLLSAYFDGEVSDDERRLMEQKLAESTELSERQSEYRDVQCLLRGIAPLSAPPDLQQTIMRLIETTGDPQRTVEPLGATVAARLPQGRNIDRNPGPLSHISAWKWPTLVAAALLAAGLPLWLQRISSPPLAAPEHVVLTRQLAPSSPDAAPLAMNEASAEVAAPASGLAMNPRTMQAAPDAPAAAASVSRDPELLRQQLLESGRTPTPGELLEYLEVINDHPVVVTYSVLDVVEAYDDVRVLLQREGIRAVSGDQTASQLSDAITSPQTVAVYLEAPSEQVEAVLREIPVMFDMPEVRLPSNQPARSEQAGNIQDGFQVALPIDGQTRQQLTSDLARKERQDKTAEPGRNTKSAVQEAERKSVLLILQKGSQ